MFHRLVPRKFLALLPVIAVTIETTSARDPIVLDTKTVFLQNDPAPGYGIENGTFDSVSSVFASLGPQGHVFFSSFVAGNPLPPSGHFYWFNGDFQNIFKGNEITSFPSLYPQRNLLGSIQLAGIDFQGNLIYQGSLSCIGGANSGSCNLPFNMVGPYNSPVNFSLVRWNEPAIGGGRLAANDQGMVAALGWITDSNSGLLRQELWIAPTNNLSNASLETVSGSEVDGLGTDPNQLLRLFGKLDLNETGQVFALVDIEDANNVDTGVNALWYSESIFNTGSLAKTGDPAPAPFGLGTVNWESLDSYEVTTETRAVLNARVRVNNVFTEGLWFLDPNNQQLVALVNASSFVGADSGEVFNNIYEYGIGRNGVIVFGATTSTGRTGVFAWDNGSVHPILASGFTVPEQPDVDVLGALSFRINSKGDILVPATVRDSGLTRTYLYLLETGETSPTIAIRSGDFADFNGTQRTVSSFDFPDSDTDEIFNDQGQIILELRTSGNRGLFVVDVSRDIESFFLEDNDAVIPVTTVPGKILGVRRTHDFVAYDHVASGIIGTGEIVEVTDPDILTSADNAYYIVVVEGCF
ncbi:MAG: hypothetical protein AAGA58_02115 [Verrucomicrobiota bacterium]